MADPAIDLPVILTQAGAQPTDPAVILATFTQLVAAEVPGYTNDLPGSLIEDMSSTAQFAIILIDGARVEAINSVTPFGANEFLLNQQGQLFGLMLGQPTNTSAPVVFTGTPQFPIPIGFAVSDGNQLYVVIDGVIIDGGGTSQPTTVVAVNPGSWPVPANTVNQIVSSIPPGFTLTCNNPNAGTPGTEDPESFASYRTRIFSAYRAAAVGMPSTIRTNLWAVPGVEQRSVTIQTPSTGGVLVLASGGGENEIALAIYDSVGDPTRLVGSVNVISGITKATHGQVTTSLKHGLLVGAAVTISGSNPTNYNGTSTIFAVIDDFNFTITVDTSAFPSYVGSAVLTPNPRNVTVPILDYPDTFQIPFANPLTQIVTGTVTWNTNLPNFTQAAAVNQAALQPLVDYVNALPTGQPLNTFEMAAVFQAATVAILPNQNLTRLVFAIDIDGVGVAPGSGTGEVQGDTQSLLTAAANAFTIAQG